MKFNINITIFVLITTVSSVRIYMITYESFKNLPVFDASIMINLIPRENKSF